MEFICIASSEWLAGPSCSQPCTEAGGGGLGGLLRNSAAGGQPTGPSPPRPTADPSPAGLPSPLPKRRHGSQGALEWSQEAWPLTSCVAIRGPVVYPGTKNCGIPSLHMPFSTLLPPAAHPHLTFPLLHRLPPGLDLPPTPGLACPPPGTKIQIQPLISPPSS